MVKLFKLLIIIILTSSVEMAFANKLVFNSVNPLRGNLDDYSCVESEKYPIVEVVMAMNEIEPASFVFCNSSQYTNLVEYVGVVFDKPEVDFSKNIDVRYVKRWYQAGGAWVEHWRSKDKVASLVPELLLKDPQLIKIDTEKK